MFNEFERSLFDLVPAEDRVCANGFVHLLRIMDPAEQLWVKSCCSRQWCEPCEYVRVMRMRQRITHYLNFHNPRHLWMVTRSIRNHWSLAVCFDQLQTVNRHFVIADSRLNEPVWRNIPYWVGTYEITYGNSGYNLHEHLIVGSNNGKIDYEMLRSLWARAAGYKAMMHFVKLNDTEHAVNYIAKYIAKGCWGGLSRGRAYLVRDTLRGKNRLVRKRGTVPSMVERGFCLCCMGVDRNRCDGMGWESGST